MKVRVVFNGDFFVVLVDIEKLDFFMADIGLVAYFNSLLFKLVECLDWRHSYKDCLVVNREGKLNL